VERIEQEAQEREARKQRIQNSEEKGWEPATIGAQKFIIDRFPNDKIFATFKRRENDSILNIFNLVLPNALLEEIWNFYPMETWIYISSGSLATINHGNYSQKLILTVLAIYIRIMGIKREGIDLHEKRPLYQAIKLSKQYFESKFGMELPGEQTLGTLISRFHIPAEFLNRISENLTNLIKHPGEVIAGDEKLLHFTGDSSCIRKVPSKPDDVGLWFYELCCKTVSGEAYMLHFQLADSSGSNLVSDIVKKWMNISRRFIPKPLLVYDSYYTDQKGRNYGLETGVRYIGAVNSVRFPSLIDIVDENVSPTINTGETQAIFKQSSSELFIRHKDKQGKVKHALSNAYRKSTSTRSGVGVRPIYDAYQKAFNICDIYNKFMKNRLFCFRTGGKGHLGDVGLVHKYTMAAICTNIFIAAKSILPSSSIPTNYHSLCIELADDIMLYSNTIHT
jgi:hypothetical protein